MGATIHLAAGFMAVPDDTAAAMCAFRRHHVDRTFEAIEVVRNPVLHNFDRFIVFVSAALAFVSARMKFVLRIARQFRCEYACPLFFLVSLDHTTLMSRRLPRVVSGIALFQLLGQNGVSVSGALFAWRSRGVGRFRFRLAIKPAELEKNRFYLR